MLSILLIFIYIAFISLGLPDAVLGAAWPTMVQSFQVPISYAGIITTFIAMGTTTSAIFSGKIVHYLGTGKTVWISVFLTAVALFGFSISTKFWHLIVLAIFYGLGAGSVDTALNHFVALHYKAKHMSWLHACWGVGATAGPLVMGFLLVSGGTWPLGYQVIAGFQTILLIALFFGMPLFKKVATNSTSLNNEQNEEQNKKEKPYPLRKTIKQKGALHAFFAFFFYCSLESTTGLWVGSFMVLTRQATLEDAAFMTTLYYIGITLGRFLSGVLAIKLSGKKMIRLGELGLIIGVILVLLPLNNFFTLVGFLIIGVGSAPIFPSLIHETPNHFAPETTASIIGLQMAMAYVGITTAPLLFGWISNKFSIALLPIYLLVLTLGILFCIEMLFIKTRKEEHV